MISRTLQFKATPLALPMAVNLNVTLGPRETRRVPLYIDRETAVTAAGSVQDVREQILIRQLLDSHLVFPQLLPETGVNYPNCLIVLEAMTGSLISGWTGSPGELDLLAIPTVDGLPHWARVSSIEVKKILINAEGSLSSGDTGTRQVLGAAQTGADCATLLHLILPEPTFTCGSKATIFAAGPDLRTRMRIKHKKQIQDLAPERVGYASVGFGHLPGVSFQQVSSADWEIIPPVPIDWRSNLEFARRRAEMIENLRAFFFRAAHESGLNEIRSLRPLYMFRSPASGRWTLSKTATFSRLSLVRA